LLLTELEQEFVLVPVQQYGQVTLHSPYTPITLFLFYDDTEVPSSMQSSEEGDQSIASRTKYQLARQRTKTTALHTESSHLRFYFEKIKNK
jgi:hypothetical protein